MSATPVSESPAAQKRPTSSATDAPAAPGGAAVTDTAATPESATPPKDAAPKQVPKAPPAGGTSLTVEDTRARDIILANARKIIFGTEGTVVAQAFSSRMAEALSAEAEAQHVARLCFDTEILPPLLSVLKERRILILTSAPDRGKSALALLLAHQLRRGDPDIREPSLRVRPLDADVRVDMIGLVKSRKTFRNRVILFKDALDRKNRDLGAFITALDALLLEHLTRALTTSSSYLILTADEGTLGALTPEVAQRILRPLQPMSEKKIREAVSNALRQTGGPEKLAEETLRQIIDLGVSIPKILRLISSYADEILATPPRVREAFDKLNDVTLRLRGDPIEHFDTWSFTFVLTLALAANPNDGVPWTEFEDLRKLLLPILLARWGLRRKAHEYNRERLSESALLAKTLAVVERDAVNGRDLLQFQERRDVAGLWRFFLAENRGLLIDVFRSLARHARADEIPFARRARFAQIIGRIGQIDSRGITKATLNEWAHSSKGQMGASTGYLLEGAWASQDDAYRECCIAMLDELTSVDSNTDEGRSALWSAIAACSRFGVCDLPVAMRKLRDIAERHLTVPTEGRRELQRALKEIQSELERRAQEGDDNVLNLRLGQSVLQAWFQAIYEHQLPVLSAVQYAIVALCLTRDPIEVMIELSSWLNRGDGLRIVTALIYLQKGGIAETVCEHAVRQDRPGNETAREDTLNPIVASLVAYPAQVKSFGKVLENLYVSLHGEFLAQDSKPLHRAFFGHLALLAKQTASDLHASSAVESLFVWLLRHGTRDLKSDLLDTMKWNKIFCDGALTQFSERVKRRALAEEGTAERLLITVSEEPRNQRRPSP